MKSLLFAFVLCLSSLALPVSAAEDLPRHFDKFAKNRYLLVVLRENGKAEYLQRQIQSDGSIYLLFDPDAAWGYFPGTPLKGQPNIWVATGQFRFDYLLEEKQLTEISKMGLQNVLTKRENGNSKSN